MSTSICVSLTIVQSPFQAPFEPTILLSIWRSVATLKPVPVIVTCAPPVGVSEGTVPGVTEVIIGCGGETAAGSSGNGFEVED